MTISGWPYQTSDAFILKLNADLDPVWLKKAWGESSEITRYLTCDADGDLFWGVEYGGSATNYADTTLSGVYANAFVAKLNPDGDLSWIQNFTADEAISMGGLEADVSANVWTTLNFGLELSFAGQALSSQGSWDNATIQFSSDGQLQQYYSMGGPERQRLYQLQALPDNRLLLVGSFSSDTLHFLNIHLPRNPWGDQYTNFFATLELPVVGTHEPPIYSTGPLGLWPNPLGRQTPLVVEAPPGDPGGWLGVWDAAGRLAGQFPLDPQSHRVVIPAGYFDPGIYWVVWQAGQGRAAAVLIVAE